MEKREPEWELDAHSKITQVDKSDNFVATKTHTQARTEGESQVPATGIGTRSQIETGTEEARTETETETGPCAVLSLAG